MGSSSQEQIVDQHSPDVEWQAKYPVGTLIESSIYNYEKPDQYLVVSRDEWTNNYELDSRYLPVKLVWEDRLSSIQELYDGFVESHIDRVISKPQPVWQSLSITKQDVGPSWSIGPWIPIDIKLDYNSMGYASNPCVDVTITNKPCPRFGVGYVTPVHPESDNKPNPRYGWRA